MLVYVRVDDTEDMDRVERGVRLAKKPMFSWRKKGSDSND